MVVPYIFSNRQGVSSQATRNAMAQHSRLHAATLFLAFQTLLQIVPVAQAVEVSRAGNGVEIRHGLEYHLGHSAVHTTALTHRLRPGATSAVEKRHGADKDSGKVAVEVDHRGQGSSAKKKSGSKGFQLTTPLEDMSSEYTGVIGVGTAQDGGPQFEARVVFDTGSTNLWVASVLCKAPPCDREGSDKFYDPEKSSTQEAFLENGMESDSDIDIIFGTGELKGPLHVDTYRVGPMAVEKQPFAMIREMQGDVFASFPFEGILGLAFPSLSFGGIEPFFERAIKTKLLKSNEFAFFLNTDSKQPSALLWGGVDKDLFEGPIVMFPVVKPHYWSLELVDFLIGGKSVKDKVPLDSKAKYVVVDSGTTYFTAPREMYNHITSKFPEAPCGDVDSYPPMQYVLRSAHNQTFTLEVSQETYMVMDEFDTCRPAFMPLDIKRKTYGPAMILGEVFMRHFFTVFARGDGALDQAKIGFARAKVGAQPKVEGQQKKDASYMQTLQVMRKQESQDKIVHPRRSL
eukprot:gb/GFBE01048412.1/.p1 GENE.gb/GFBE01048412.1/~~gb/GFBE01048412.1/.p1  ORF type:complete len:515 (+),score=105.41 gb/GFBE01048412.1/:1-1545(+)